MLFEKIFQRDDKTFLNFYHFILGIILYISAVLSYYLINNSWNLPETYLKAP